MSDTQKHSVTTMTRQEAKDLCLKVWQYLVDHPEVSIKCEIPFYSEIRALENRCPLCELFFEDNCEGCPLETCYNGSMYYQWAWSEDPCARQAAAQTIVDRVKAWDC